MFIRRLEMQVRCQRCCSRFTRLAGGSMVGEIGKQYYQWLLMSPLAISTNEYDELQPHHRGPFKYVFGCAIANITTFTARTSTVTRGPRSLRSRGPGLTIHVSDTLGAHLAVRIRVRSLCHSGHSRISSSAASPSFLLPAVRGMIESLCFPAAAAAFSSEFFSQAAFALAVLRSAVPPE